MSSADITASQSSVCTHDKPRPVIRCLYDTMVRLEFVRSDAQTDFTICSVIQPFFINTTFRLNISSNY